MEKSVTLDPDREEVTLSLLTERAPLFSNQTSMREFGLSFFQPYDQMRHYILEPLRHFSKD